jgi:HPt (histidine-containing phosphotransfer) domain-containing protein
MPDPRTTALADLDRAIAGLEATPLSPRDSEDVAQLRKIARRLAGPDTPALQSFDPVRFRNLLDLAGPKMAGELLAQLASDLDRCRTQARHGAAARDWGALRASSHVLISLAGSVGALSLQAMAERLHLAATLGSGEPGHALVTSMILELDGLIALVQSTPAPAGDSA